MRTLIVVGSLMAALMAQAHVAGEARQVHWTVVGGF